MKIYYLSNLWVDIDSLNLEIIKPDPDGILLVGGDIIPADYIKNNKSDGYNKFLDLISGFDKCIFVLGELEHFDSFYEATYSIFLNYLKTKSPHKFFLLENEHMKLNEKTYVFGATFWAKGSNKNIYDSIKTRDGAFTREIVEGLHKESKNYLNAFCKELLSKNIIVLSHFPPEIDVINDNSNISHWVYGHGYNKLDYMYNQCFVTNNPIVGKQGCTVNYFEIEG